MTRILVTGAFGQIGTELTRELRRRYGHNNVIASSRQATPDPDEPEPGPYVPLDVTDRAAVEETLRQHRVNTVYHLAALLSAVGERNPQRAWHVNTDGLYNLLEAARACDVRRLFVPSSIAAFGPDTPRDQTPQDTIMRPTTIYGVTKVVGELLGDYYFRRYGIDVRGVRYPGVISSEALPGGGTTDYAVEIFHAALTEGRYTCFVRRDTVLPMIFMPDCIKAAIDLMEADGDRLQHRSGFNVAAMSFSAGELADEIRRHLPDFVCEFEPDERQAIADSWPRSLDDSAARAEWDWRPDYDLPAMTTAMLDRLRERLTGG